MPIGFALAVGVAVPGLARPAAAAPSSYAVGRQIEVLVDQHRSTPPNGKIPGHPTRRLDTTILYPAEGSPGGQPIDAATPDRRDGPYPLVVFAHGFGSNLSGYEETLRRWAAAGYVVAAPLFPLTRTDAPGGPILADYANQPGDLSFVISQVVDESARRSGRLVGMVDPRRIGAAGHSLGGVTTLGLVSNTCCKDPRVRAAVVMSGDPINFPHGRFPPGAAPPLLLVHGDADPDVPYISSIDAFKSARAPKGLLTVAGGDHGSPVNADGPAFPSVVRAEVDFFDRYLKGDQAALARLRADGQPGVSSLIFMATPSERVTPPAPPSTAAPRNRHADVTPSRGLITGQTVTVSWRDYAPGITINVLQCSNSPPTGPNDCDLQSAKLIQPDPDGHGSLPFVVHSGKVGTGVCDANHHCVIVINEGGSLQRAASVIIPVTFRR